MAGAGVQGRGCAPIVRKPSGRTSLRLPRMVLPLGWGCGGLVYASAIVPRTLYTKTMAHRNPTVAQIHALQRRPCQRCRQRGERVRGHAMQIRRNQGRVPRLA